MIRIGSKDFAILCICAVRYCFGRKTYMPSLVQGIVIKNMSKISDEYLSIILEDLHEMNEYDHGDPVIDKPEWIKFCNSLELEKFRRKSAHDQIH